MPAKVEALDGGAQGHEALTAITTVKTFTSTLYAPTTGAFAGRRAKAALITVETAAIRFTLDGTTPVVTATGGGVGHEMKADQSYRILGSDNIAGFQCINETNANGAVVRVTFFF